MAMSILVLPSLLEDTSSPRARSSLPNTMDNSGRRMNATGTRASMVRPVGPATRKSAANPEAKAMTSDMLTLHPSGRQRIMTGSIVTVSRGVKLK